MKDFQDVQKILKVDVATFFHVEYRKFCKILPYMLITLESQLF